MQSYISMYMYALCNVNMYTNIHTNIHTCITYITYIHYIHTYKHTHMHTPMQTCAIIPCSHPCVLTSRDFTLATVQAKKHQFTEQIHEEIGFLAAGSAPSPVPNFHEFSHVRFNKFTVTV